MTSFIAEILLAENREFHLPFSGIVRAVYVHFYCTIHSFQSFEAQTQAQRMEGYASDRIAALIDYIYDHLDAFRLLANCAHGSAFQGFIEELVDVEVEYTRKYMATMGLNADGDEIIGGEFLHIVFTSYYESLFEVVRHGMSRDKAKLYVAELSRYHLAGFRAVFERNSKPE